MKQFHEQVEIELKGVNFYQDGVAISVKDAIVEVDAYISRLINLIWVNLGINTYESCENYGEYLRDLGLDHIFESKRDYAYIEFYSLEDADYFQESVLGYTGVVHPIYHQITHEGTPDAWELKVRQSTGNYWVWFPSSEIEELEKLLDA
jgi:hypothetical protein